MSEREEAERFADPIDAGSKTAEEFTADRIEVARRLAGPESHPDFEAPYCLDCGTEIPEQRLALGKIRCVHCQQLKENQSRMFRKAT